MSERKRAAGAGRKPRGPISGNDGFLQTRIPADLLALIDEAAKASNRSRSQEAAVRLYESFNIDWTIGIKGRVFREMP